MIKSMLRDTILGTLLIFLILFSLSEVFDKLEILDPVGEALEDVEMTDILYSDENLRADSPIDTNIVVINIGNLPRRGIAEQIRIINQYKPKAIGIDTFFATPKDPEGDSLLAAALAEVENLIMPTQLLYNDEIGDFGDLKLSLPMFNENASLAHVNLITGVGVQQTDVKTCREFSPSDKLGDEEIVAFGVKLAEFIAPEKAKRFLERGNDFETIKYKGNSIDFLGKYIQMFPALDVEDVFYENFVPEMIEGKLVLFGFMGENFGDVYNTEDKYFTPMNEKYAGRGSPDMFGVVIHANIISMILNEDYIDTLDDNWEMALAVIMCLLNAWFCTWVNLRLPYWYDGITKIVILLELIALFFITFSIFAKYSFKVELTIGLICVALSSEVMEFYHGIVKSMLTRKGRRQIFKVYKEGKLSELN